MSNGFPDWGSDRIQRRSPATVPARRNSKWVELLFVIFVGITVQLTLTASVTLVSAAPQDESGSIPEQEHGLSPKAVEIARLSHFPITNSMVVTWIVGLGLITFAQLATRRMKQVPSGAQN